MRRIKAGVSPERMFLIAMATRRAFLAGINGQVDIKSFEGKYARLVAGWCLKFFHEHDRAPKRGELNVYFNEWSGTNVPDHEVEDVRDFLEGLSEQYDKTKKRPNISFLFKSFSKYMTLRKAQLLVDSLSVHLGRGDDREVLSAITAFKSVDLGASVGFDPINDRSAWERTFAEPAKPLIDFPRKTMVDAHWFFCNALTRGALVGIQGPEKRGKSNMLIEFAFRALRQGLRVAMFQVGDLREVDIMRRFMVRMSKRPLYEKDLRTKILVPDRIQVVKNDAGEFEPELFGDYLRPKHTIVLEPVWRAKNRLMESFGIPAGETRFMLDVEYNSTINVTQIDSILQRWQDDLGFIADVVLLDYADILAPENPKAEERKQIIDTWRALRRLSQKRDALVITATQANSASYDVKTQRMKHFSGSKTKNADVTAMLTLNQSDSEKEQGIMRLGWSVLREGDFNPDHTLWIGQCPALCRAICCASFYHPVKS